MDSRTLAGILKNFYPSFDMSFFQNRLKLQKVIYLIQANGINLGFGFNFYLYGPYSTDLARAGFQIEEYSTLKLLTPDDETVNEKFKSIIEKLEAKKDDIKWLECASSIIYLKNLGFSKEKIVKDVGSKLTIFPRDYIEKVWIDLNEKGWIYEEE